MVCRTNSCNVAAQLTSILEEGNDDQDEGQEPLLGGSLEPDLPLGTSSRRTADADEDDVLPGSMRHARTSVIMRQVCCVRRCHAQPSLLRLAHLACWR